MDDKNFEKSPSADVMISREEKRGHSGKYLKTVITAFIMAAILITSGIFVINRKAEIETKQSSFKLTDFDYAVNSPTKEQVNDLAKNPAVEKIFPCYLFSITANGGVSLSLLMSDSLDGYEIGLFNEDTCISGKADKAGIMLDETAAKKLHVKVGDTVSFPMNGKTVSLKVSGIYMACTYPGLQKGLGLAVFTDEMKSYYKKEIGYKKAFIDAKDTAACEETLKDYLKLGELLDEADYKGGLSYDDYKTAFMKSARDGAVETKSAFALDAKEQIETRENDITYVSGILGAASFIAYALLGIIFIYMNKSDDKIILMEGVPHARIQREYMYSNLIGALIVSVVTGIALLIAASLKHHLVACLPIVLLSALPVIPAAVVVGVYAKVYLNKLYSVQIDRTQQF